MQLVLQRTTLTKRSTIGRLFVDGEPQCFTLEQVYREVPNEPVEKWKVPSLTAIPLGTYQISLATFHPKTNPADNPAYEAPLLANVDDFIGIFIHIGNAPADTEGCILVGTESSTDWVSNSREAFEQLLDTVRNGITTGVVSLTIEMHMDLQPQFRRLTRPIQTASKGRAKPGAFVKQ